MLEILDAEPKPEILLRPKKIVVDGQEVGEVEAWRATSGLRWMATLPISDSRFICRWLIQGHGATPHEAVANAIVRGRGERDAMAEKLAELESLLGVTGKTNDELMVDFQ